MFNAVLISLGSCAVLHIAWHLFIRRSHRGEHARADEMYSPYALAVRVEREWSQPDKWQGRFTGNHDVGPDRDVFVVGMLSGELPLLSGYGNDFAAGPRTAQRFAWCDYERRAPEDISQRYDHVPVRRAS